MIRYLLSRLITLGIFAFFLAAVSHFYHSKVGEQGRDAFLAHQADRFDRFYAHPSSIVLELIAVLFMLGFLFVAYEVVAFVVLKILEQIKTDEAPYAHSNQN